MRITPLSERMSPRSAAALFAIAIQLVALWLFQVPSFTFAFSDAGANLTVQQLMAHGLVPLADFNTPYGLMPLLFGKLWFGIFGATARTYGLATFVCSLLVGFAL